jgi:hypothetical protein
MKTIFTTAAFIFTAGIASAQLNFKDASSVSGTHSEEVREVFSNQNGDLFYTGTFEGNLTIGSHNIQSMGGKDIFLMKKNALGQVSWIKAIGTIENEESPVLIEAQNGELVLGGAFRGSLDLDGTVYQSAGGTDGFVARYNTDGVLMTSWTLGGLGNDKVKAFARSTNSTEILVAGEFSGLSTFGPAGAGSNTQLMSNGGTDIFFVRYIQGRCAPVIEAFKVGSVGNDRLGSVAYDQSGNMVIAGGFNRPIDLNPFASSMYVQSEGNYDFFVSRFDGQGNPLFMRNFGGVGNDFATTLAVSDQNEIFVGGFFHQNLQMGAYSLTSNGESDAFLARLELNGNVVWANSYGGSKDDQISELEIQGNNRLWVAGESASQFDFNPAQVGGEFASLGMSDIFLLGVDKMGVYQEMTRFGGIGQEAIRGIETLGNDLVLVGSFEETVNFDPSFRMAAFTSQGGTDGFEVRFSTQMANGVVAQEGNSPWGIFPTLATDFVQINNQGGSAEMRMLDANGKVILTEKITSNSQKVIDLMNVPSGVYWVQRIQNGKMESRKMVKM